MIPAPAAKALSSTIKQLKKKYKVDFMFADEDHAAEHLLDQIEDLIKKADYCLFDVSSWNTNVVLELGYARGCGKKHAVLFRPTSTLLTPLGFMEEHAEVPSDIKGLKQLRYFNEGTLRVQLDELLADLIENPNLVRAAEMFTARVEELLARHPQGMLMREVATQLEIDQQVASGIIRKMVREGQVETTGYGNATRYLRKQIAEHKRTA